MKIEDFKEVANKIVKEKGELKIDEIKFKNTNCYVLINDIWYCIEDYQKLNIKPKKSECEEQFLSLLLANFIVLVLLICFSHSQNLINISLTTFIYTIAIYCNFKIHKAFDK